MPEPWILIDTRAYIRKGDASGTHLDCKQETITVAFRQRMLLTPSAALPDRADRMNDMLGRRRPAPVITALPGGRRLRLRISMHCSMISGPPAL